MKSFLACLLFPAIALAAEPATQPTTLPGIGKPVGFLSADETLKTFSLPPELRIEVVAAEPMVQHPVSISFDPDGRMWVVEMRSYMPDVDGEGEKEPDGRISILEDTDGDGRMDKSTSFLDGVVLPRALGLVRDGALVAIPPNLFFCRDTDGDGKSDEQAQIVSDYGIRGNPEHQPNGLMHTLDNWIVNANYDKRFKFTDGKWIIDQVNDVGQWGVTQDNLGRIFTNSNSDQLRFNPIPEHYADRNPHFRAGGINVRTAADQWCWPPHNTAVNRRRMFDYAGRLAYFTGACGPVIYRGGVFPKEYDGNAFIAEPVANFIRRDVLTETDGTIRAENAYYRGEFLTTPYERFRPVNLFNGPDGALYIVDMHHGLIQHKTYETPEVIADYKQRQLDKHLETGRIYRIVPREGKLFPRPNMSRMKSVELVKLLSHPNGWWRDTAQRLVVERNDPNCAPALTQLATKGEDPLARLHALWALDAMHRLDSATLRVALADADSRIRAAAIRLSEPLLYRKDVSERVMPQVLALASDQKPHVRLQFVLTTSALGTDEVDNLLEGVLRESSDKPLLIDAAVSGMRGREISFLELVLSRPGWEANSPGRSKLLSTLAKCVLAEANPKRVMQLLDLIAAQPADQHWRQVAMLDAFPEVTASTRPARRGIVLPTEPTALSDLQKSRPSVRAKIPNILATLHWPGQRGYTPPPPPKPLTPSEQARFEAGKLVYAATCTQCHKPDGLGQAGLAPPLVDSEWVLGSQSRLARIVVNGMSGPITVDGNTFNLDMPGLSVLTDEQIAAVLTYVRRSWDQDASPVEVETVKSVREQIGSRNQPWTERELLKVSE